MTEIESFLRSTYDLLAKLEQDYALCGNAPIFADLISDLLERTHTILAGLNFKQPNADLAEALQIIEPHRAFARERSEAMRRTLH